MVTTATRTRVSSNGRAAAGSATPAKNAAAEFRASHGWCPICSLSSVVRGSRILICSSPSCGWRATRTPQLEEDVFGGTPELTAQQLDDLRASYGLH